MIDALSNTYKELAAATLGVPPGEVSVLMVHRPHEEKDYADQSVYFFFHGAEKFPSVVGKVGFDPAGAHYLERERRALAYAPAVLSPAEIRKLCGERLARFDALLLGDVPVAHREGQPRAAAARPGGDRDRRLRRLRPVRRERARRGAVSVFLSR